MSEQQIGGDGDLYQGEDKTLRWRIRNASTNALVDITGWAIAFDVRTADSSTTALISKTATISGTYNATEGLNDQYASVTLADDDTTSLTAPRKYRYSLKRTDPGLEDVLRTGDFLLEKATQS